jgi:methyltransferase (TIGR00027 family)
MAESGTCRHQARPETGHIERIQVADEALSAPDSTAVRVALWRALHVQLDPLPHVLEDEVGLDLAAPEEGWRGRGDMDPVATSGFRASIVARARFVEDLVAEEAAKGVDQYVILGAGLDTFAQRMPDLASTLQVFEVDPPGPQAWKRQRLDDLGLGVPEWLHLVPVDFESSDGWKELAAAGFDSGRSAVVASTGVTMYVTKDATASTLRRVAALAAGSTLVMTFLLPPRILEAPARAVIETTEQNARASGTPFISFFSPEEMLALANDAGFRAAQCFPTTDLGERYFADRPDGLQPPRGESLLLATT